MNPISFKANFIKSVNIQPKPDKKYTASMVELNSSDKADMRALREVAGMWGYETYAYDIYSSAVDDYSPVTKDSHIYAITRQKSGFEHLKSSDVLCVAQFSEGKLNELDCIQVMPAKKRKKIGSAMLNAIKTLHPEPMYIHSAPLVTDFYKNNNCTKSSESDLVFYANV